MKGFGRDSVTISAFAAVAVLIGMFAFGDSGKGSYCGLERGQSVLVDGWTAPVRISVTMSESDTYGNFKVESVDRESRVVTFISHGGTLRVALPFHSIGVVLDAQAE